MYLTGLKRDDIIIESPEVKEALRRLPAYMQDERQFRISRAFQLSTTKTILPKEEWSLYEDVRKLKITKSIPMTFQDNYESPINLVGEVCGSTYTFLGNYCLLLASWQDSHS